MSAGTRVSFLTPSFPLLPSGGARTYYEHASGLARRGYDVSIVHPLNLRPRYPQRIVDLARHTVRGIRARSLRRRVNWMDVDPRVNLHFVDELTESTPLPPADVRVGTFWRTNEILGQRDDGSARVQLIQAHETWGGPPDRVNATWRLDSELAVVSHPLLDVGRHLGVNADRLHLVPNGIDSLAFHPDVLATRRAPRLAFHVSPVPIKGLDDTIAVIHQVHRNFPDLPMTAFGTGRRPLSLPRFVEYFGNLRGSAVSEKVYRQATIFLCTSHSEGWGFPSMEAMACGAALVSTRNGGVDEFAQDRVSGLLCEVGDISALATAIGSLLRDHNLRDEIARRGAQRVTSFTWRDSTDAFEGVVKAALSHRERVS